MMNSKLIGGILLVVGTTIGAGMLALPLVTAGLTFWGSLVLLISIWALMTTCAFLFLEVNLALPQNSNLISMAGITLGKFGQIITWIVYLFLLYSVLSAYISGAGDLFHYLLATYGINLPLSVASILITALLGSVVYFGIRSVDYVNRMLMLGKLSALFLLVILISPFISFNHLSGVGSKITLSPSSITVTAVAFGSLMIIPSLRDYFEEDIQALRKAILIGTFIPLICYIAWEAVILGVIPWQGDPGLQNISHSTTSSSDLIAALAFLIHNQLIAILAKFFTSICMLTTFLSISLSLSDFLADGLRIKKQGKGKIIVFAATFMPPILIALFCPGAFIYGLSYAGIGVFILMILLPALMTWRGRYHTRLMQSPYQVSGGKFLLAMLLVFATLMIGFGLDGAI